MRVGIEVALKVSEEYVHHSGMTHGQIMQRLNSDAWSRAFHDLTAQNPNSYITDLQAVQIRWCWRQYQSAKEYIFTFRAEMTPLPFELRGFGEQISEELMNG